MQNRNLFLEIFSDLKSILSFIEFLHSGTHHDLLNQLNCPNFEFFENDFKILQALQYCKRVVTISTLSEDVLHGPKVLHL